MPRNAVRFALVPLAILAVAGAAGCTKSVDSATLEKQISKKLQAQVGQKPKDVNCPDGLQANPGAKTRCTLTTPQGPKFDVMVKVTSVDGDQVNYNIKVADQPKS